jgi:hypothetical protein
MNCVFTNQSMIVFHLPRTLNSIRFHLTNPWKTQFSLDRTNILGRFRRRQRQTIRTHITSRWTILPRIPIIAQKFLLPLHLITRNPPLHHRIEPPHDILALTISAECWAFLSVFFLCVAERSISLNGSAALFSTGYFELISCVPAYFSVVLPVCHGCGKCDPLDCEYDNCLCERFLHIGVSEGCMFVLYDE